MSEFKRKHKFKPSRRLLLMSFLTVISLCTSALATFAWLDASTNAVDKDLIFTSGGSTLKVNVFGHAPKNDSNIAEEQNVLITTGHKPYAKGDEKMEYDESKGFININYKLCEDNFGLNRLPNSDITISTENLPRYYLELRYIQHDTNGFVKLNIENFKFDESVPNQDNIKNISKDIGLSYRYITNKNNEYHNYLDGFEAATSSSKEFANGSKITNENWNKIENNNSFIPIYSSKDWKGHSESGYTGAYYDNQLFVPSYHETYEKKNENGEITFVQDYYSKSTVIEIGIDPESYIKQIKKYINNNTYDFQFKVAFSFDISITYSHAIFTN